MTSLPHSDIEALRQENQCYKYQLELAYSKIQTLRNKLRVEAQNRRETCTSIVKVSPLPSSSLFTLSSRVSFYHLCHLLESFFISLSTLEFLSSSLSTLSLFLFFESTLWDSSPFFCCSYLLLIYEAKRTMVQRERILVRTSCPLLARDYHRRRIWFDWQRNTRRKQKKEKRGRRNRRHQKETKDKWYCCLGWRRRRGYGTSDFLSFIFSLFYFFLSVPLISIPFSIFFLSF